MVITLAFGAEGLRIDPGCERTFYFFVMSVILFQLADWLKLFTMKVSSDPALSLGFFLLGSAFNKSVKSRSSETFSPMVYMWYTIYRI